MPTIAYGVENGQDSTQNTSLLPAGRQLSGVFRFFHTAPKNPNLEIIDDWLALLLVEPAPEGEEKRAWIYNKEPAWPRNWLSRCLELARYLFQAARIPVFDGPEILACKLEHQEDQQDGDSEKWHITITLPSIQGIPQYFYTAVLRVSFILAEWVQLREPTNENLALFFSYIEKILLLPNQKLLAPGKSTLQVLKAAYHKGIPFSHVGSSVYQLGWGANARRIDRSTTELDSAMGSRISQSKALTVKLLRSAGLPSPRHKLVKDMNEALETANSLGWPVVVKPSDLDGGVGVTVDVSDQAKLESAVELATGFSSTKEVIVEQQVNGVCHRLFISNGALLYAVKRLPMLVVGDGEQTVSELVARGVELQQRIPPWQRSKIVPLDPLALETIHAAGFSESSVPDTGVQVPLRRIESTEWGGVDEDVTTLMHPENLRIALAAVRLFRLNVAGVDIISSDISAPWYENNAVINEVNFAPLLGGGEISRRHIPRFLDQYIGGDGRVPVEVFVGGKSAWQAASDKWQKILGEGVKCYLTNEAEVLDPSGNVLHMPTRGLYHKVRALVLSSEVEAIVLVVQTDEILDTGLPLEFVDAVTHIDDHLVSYKSRKDPLSPNRSSHLVRMLNKW